MATVSYSFLLLLAVYLCSQRLLVLGGGGAVGLAAIQIAVAAGCSVSATCGSQSIERVLAFGAEQAIDYTAEVSVVYLSSCHLEELIPCVTVQLWFGRRLVLNMKMFVVIANMQSFCYNHTIIQ